MHPPCFCKALSDFFWPITAFREGLLWVECGYWVLGTAGSDTNTPCSILKNHKPLKIRGIINLFMMQKSSINNALANSKPWPAG